jgi:hypothetical protein
MSPIKFSNPMDRKRMGRAGKNLLLDAGNPSFDKMG